MSFSRKCFSEAAASFLPSSVRRSLRSLEARTSAISTPWIAEDIVGPFPALSFICTKTSKSKYLHNNVQIYIYVQKRTSTVVCTILYKPSNVKQNLRCFLWGLMRPGG